MVRRTLVVNGSVAASDCLQRGLSQGTQYPPIDGLLAVAYVKGQCRETISFTYDGPLNDTGQLESTHRVQTSANAVRYPKAYPSKNVINIRPQLFQFIFNA